MANCKHIKSLFDKALYNELSQSEQKEFDIHLKECASCSKEYSELESTLSLVVDREREEASPEFLDNLWETIEPEIENFESEKNYSEGFFEKIKSIFLLEPAWTKQLAVGLTILIIGIFIGRSFWNNESGNPIVPHNNNEGINAVNVAVQAKAERYLDRSKVLLLGLINYDEKANAGIIDLEKQKEISESLVAEAADLKNELNAPEQRRLKKLVSDLEVVLLQIANLESKYDVTGIDMVKEGVDKRGIFLKINIQKMLQNSSTQEADEKKEIEKNI